MANPLTITATASPSLGIAPVEVTFKAVTSNPGASWVWLLGETVIGTTESITHTFTVRGTYRVTVQVVDIFSQAGVSDPVRAQVSASSDSLDIAIDLAVEDNLVNTNYRNLKFYGSGFYSPNTKGIGINIPSTVNDPNHTGLRRGRGPSILFD